ncbi:hypothetical protein OAU50_01245 [Planctomycetota bacterium]|nr:hypothetical protein [Planctomycetota bacterium]
MPYIKQERRDELDPHIEALLKALPSESFAGDLNYSICRLADGLLTDKKNYARLNEIIGALECAKLELYRRMAAPYEDQKVTENGDVF